MFSGNIYIPGSLDIPASSFIFKHFVELKCTNTESSYAKFRTRFTQEYPPFMYGLQCTPIKTILYIQLDFIPSDTETLLWKSSMVVVLRRLALKQFLYENKFLSWALTASASVFTVLLQTVAKTKNATSTQSANVTPRRKDAAFAPSHVRIQR